MHSRYSHLLALAGGALFVAAAGPTAHAQEQPAALLGFGAASARAEIELERRFDAALNAHELRDWLERMSSAPNHVGAPHDKANAEFMLELFRSWGWEADIETFYVLYPTPRRLVLELVAPTHFKAALHEPPISGDRTSTNPQGALPPFNAYGADGDVSGELVYVNYGMPDDYLDLARRGITLKGRIAIARYGGGWRGLKPKLAYEHGAIGCIIYSDPRDDGYSAGDPYPRGAGRPADGVQRGSVVDMPVYPGDPLTPGVGSTRDAIRLARADAKTLQHIPVLPISYADAEPLLRALGGARAPARARGSLPFTYHLGPGPAKVHLAVESKWEQWPVYDVVARLSGSRYPDEWVIRGNHHDGWVFGAADPLSGNVALMAEMKALGALAKGGWRPQRTLIYASWDGEEPGLIGSTEWVETHGAELAAKAVAYVNSDSNSRGFLNAGGSHSLQRLVNEVASGVTDPATGASVLARARARALVAGTADAAAEEPRQIARALLAGGDWPLEALGSGSDFTPFLQHAGIATLHLEFGEDEADGVYHSIYDSFDHYVRIEDPDFGYGVALATTAGHVMLRLAAADLLPLRFGDSASAVGHYVEQLEQLAAQLRERTATTERLLAERSYELATSRADPVGPPEHEAPVPFLNFAPLQNAAAALAASARSYDALAAARLAADPSAAQLAAANAVLRAAEQALLGAQGLPGRAWYRHLVYAPGLYTGYGVKTLPGVREAIEQRRFDEAAEYVVLTARALDAYRAAIDAASSALR